MNASARDARSFAAVIDQPVSAGRAEGRVFWDALWTLDDEWHPDPDPLYPDAGPTERSATL